MGGKRKSAKPPPKAAKPKLDKLFDCPFCNNEKSVSAKLNFDNDTGKVSCAKCGAHYEARITSLSDPIDVYSDWIDACEAANREAEPGAAPGDAARGGGGGGAVQRAAPADQDDDDE